MSLLMRQVFLSSRARNSSGPLVSQWLMFENDETNEEPLTFISFDVLKQPVGLSVIVAMEATGAS